MPYLNTGLWTAAATTYGIVTAAVFAIFVASWVLLKWNDVKCWIEENFSNRPEQKLKSIFREYMEKITSIEDRKKLYKEILSLVAKIADCDTASLLLKSQTGSTYIVRESLGSKPVSFRISDMDEFVEVLAAHKRTITRAEIVGDNRFAKAKTAALKYSVQFHAEAIIPLVIGGRLMGIINVGCRKDGLGFDYRVLEIFDLMSVQFAIAINNANLYEGLARQNIKLRELDDLRRQILANVTHELKTPLNSIIGLSEIILEGADGKLSPEQEEHIKMIYSSGKRLLDTVNTLLDLSKLEANRLALDVKRVSIKKMLDEIETKLPKKDEVSIEIRVKEDAPPVYGDERWISKVFGNLLGNAIKYTPKGVVYVDCDRMGDMIKIGVHDTGIGIDKNTQKAIFAGFRQGSSGVGREHEGTGLGLAISKKIVELHGGRMWLNSEPGKGSHFFFTLPLKPDSIPFAEIPTHLDSNKDSNKGASGSNMYS